MCGIAGILTSPRTDIVADAFKMAQALNHRGPDDSGIWVDEHGVIGLAHTRLAVIDLSPAGHQPMVSSGGRYVLVFNGEIYNHLAIRKEMEAISAAPIWCGHSDTETLLAAVEHWGLDVALAKTVGMFALAIWDKRTRSLSLARDRLGEKPLYYGWVGKEFIFASELKAFKALDAFDGKVCRRALSHYMQRANIPAPYSIYQGIYKLEPGCALRVTGCQSAPPTELLRAPVTFGPLRLYRWWDLAQVKESGLENRIKNEKEAIDALDAAIVHSVDLQSLADVPVGAFLSGGIDSSLVVALMQQRSSRPIQTFTVAFEEPEFDESSYARSVATYLATEHTELTVGSTEAMELIPKLAEIYDEPFADASQIPTFLISRLARSRVAVSLTGDGGDELFGGYDHYHVEARIWSIFERVPYPLRRSAGLIIRKVPRSALEGFAVALNSLLPKNRYTNRLTSKIETVSTLLSSSRDIIEFHRTFLAQWKTSGSPVLDLDQIAVHESVPPIVQSMGCEEAMMYLDALDFLPNSVLCKVDRAAMANSLETRAPLLDHRVVEISSKLPLGMRLRRGSTKWALRQVLYRRVPPKLVERPKAGFSVPLGSWLRGPLREWAEALLDESNLVDQGFLDPVPIREKWKQHLTGVYDHSGSLWTVLMFQSWLENEAGIT
jgi:asparagine synthase (glutamine-hydrolysing)